MKKLTFDEAIEISNILNKKSYTITPFYIYYNFMYIIKNNEKLLVDYDPIDIQNINQQVLPKKKENQINSSFDLLNENELKELNKNKIEILFKKHVENEYWYSTKEWQTLEGPKFRIIRKKINKFKKENNYKILFEYDLEKIKKFILNWESKRENKKNISKISKTYLKLDAKHCIDTLNNINKFENKKIFVELNNKLIGFAIIIPFKDYWVALMQKTDLKYNGLSEFLYNEKAKLMNGIFTTGPAAGDKNLSNFKLSLRPIKVEKLYYVETGNFKC